MGLIDVRSILKADIVAARGVRLMIRTHSLQQAMDQQACSLQAVRQRR
jgi:hypothetical protein